MIFKCLSDEVYLGVREQALPNFPALSFGEKRKEVDALVLRYLLPLEILLFTSKLSPSCLWINTNFRASLILWSTWPLHCYCLFHNCTSVAPLNVWNTDSSCSDWQCCCTSAIRQEPDNACTSSVAAGAAVSGRISVQSCQPLKATHARRRKRAIAIISLQPFGFVPSPYWELLLLKRKIGFKTRLRRIIKLLTCFGIA